MGQYHATLLDQGVWRVVDGDGSKGEPVDLYLVAGSERALVIDAGVSGADLRSFVQTLTDKPLTLAVLHGHGDHAAAIGQFDDVYLSHLENPDHIIWGRHFDLSTTKDLTDGMTFDLGGVTLEAIALPGHTPGSFVLLDRARRLLFSSDSVGSTRIWLQIPGCLKPGEFAPHVARLERLTEGMDDLRIFVGHSYQAKAEPTRAYLSDLRTLAEDVGAGRVEGRPATKEESPFGGLVASRGQLEQFIYRA